MNNLPTKILGANNVSTQNLNRQHYWQGQIQVSSPQFSRIKILGTNNLRTKNLSANNLGTQNLGITNGNSQNLGQLTSN